MVPAMLREPEPCGDWTLTSTLEGLDEKLKARGSPPTGGGLKDEGAVDRRQLSLLADIFRSEVAVIFNINLGKFGVGKS